MSDSFDDLLRVNPEQVPNGLTSFISLILLKYDLRDIVEFLGKKIIK